MNSNQQLIETFYTAFNNRDYKTMQNYYADNATFSDEVFSNLNAGQVKAMWEMLCIRAKNLHIEYSNIMADEKTGSAEWLATYTFAATGKKVVNKIKARFVFDHGCIVAHVDSFNFYKWASQALGFKGVLLGRTSFLKNKVRRTAMKSLENFMKKK